MEDREILDLYWNRDEQAVAETEKKYGGRLTALAVRMIRREDAEECVNDTYAAAWNRIPPVRPLHFYAWLAKVCRNRVSARIEYLRAAKRDCEWISLEEELSLSVPGNPTEEALEEKELGRLLSSFLRDLPYEKRMIFMRRYWYGNSVAEIAGMMSCTESKVKVTLHRTRNHLKEYLEKEGGIV